MAEEGVIMGVEVEGTLEEEASTSVEVSMVMDQDMMETMELMILTDTTRLLQ